MNEINSSTQENVMRMRRKMPKRQAGQRHKSSLMKMDVNAKTKSHKTIRYKKGKKR
jgi:hypothetical protein